jgi:hypothetical protein
MKQFKILLPVVLLVFVACNNRESKKEENHDNHQKSEMNDEQKSSKEEHEETAGKVQLDNGTKWKANAETLTGINNMLALAKNGITAKTEPANLHDTLQAEFKTIFDKCTMTGESHNQLYTYLIPLKGRLEELKAGSTNAEILKEIQEYLLTFKNYFE